jgi:MtN3 and saliva related transmembrane protein
MRILDAIGYAAALLTTASYVPQVLRVLRTRSTKDISLRMFLTLMAGLGLWLVYGICIGELPLIAANAVSLALAGLIVFFKVREL